MATKSKSVYVCSSCGGETPKWSGRCPACGEWNTISEEPVTVAPEKPGKAARAGRMPTVTKLNDISHVAEARYETGLRELDRVLGGGIVKGSILLMSGDPGIGKSTMLLQICDYLGRGHSVLYVTGEESERQIKLRASRLGVTAENLEVMAETDMESICEYMRVNRPEIAIIDSIQTMNFSELNSSPGSVSQVRECTALLLRTCKPLEIPVFVVGHVTKVGGIAGPKVLEHIVDAVLYFEGDRSLNYRILRAVKNRYGATNEIGVFEMGELGLREVENPSMMLLSGRPLHVSGTCVACVMEGSRPILAEVQGLVSPTSFGVPRRMSTGFDYNRMALLMAVLEKRAGYYFNNMDAYVNIVGGLRLDEPSADLPVSISLVSSLKDAVVPSDVITFGEIGLAGEVRGVANAEARIAECARLGFKRCILPRNNLRQLSEHTKGLMELIGVRTVREAFEAL